MTPKWLIALAVVLAIGLSGSVVAGPKHPNDYGDPDIYEGVKVREEAPRERLAEEPTTCLTVDIPFYHQLICVRQERTLRLSTIPGKVAATSDGYRLK